MSIELVEELVEFGLQDDPGYESQCPMCQIKFLQVNYTKII